MLLEIQVGMDAFGGTVVVAIRRQVVCAIPAQHPVLIVGNRRQSGDRDAVRSDQAPINGGRAAVRQCSTWLSLILSVDQLAGLLWSTDTVASLATRRQRCADRRWKRKVTSARMIPITARILAM